MSQHIICVRSVSTKNGSKSFGSEPGATRFLKVPNNAPPHPEDHRIGKAEWVSEVLENAETGTNPETGKPIGDILVFVHGYNADQKTVLKRHRTLEADVHEAGFKGTVISYDWPSGTSAMAYLEDRDDAKATAKRLRDDCIGLFSARQARGCEINIHILAHSTGAYVVRQAFSDSDESNDQKNRPWKVSQIALIAADVSRRSLADEESRSESLYRHCIRLTNYQNPHDSVLKLSNVKRIGLSPRAGRVGLPENASHKAVNVNCGEYFESLDEDALTQGVDYYGNFSHSWHIGDKTFAKDLVHTLHGDTDRHAIPTRKMKNGDLILDR